MLNRSFATRIIWLILIILALAGAAIFASNIFLDWQEERTITSLKTISKPVNELDFPSVTICKDGQNLQAVMKMVEKDNKKWAGKRTRAVVGAELDYCQLLFHRDCKQVVILYFHIGALANYRKYLRKYLH